MMYHIIWFHEDFDNQAKQPLVFEGDFIGIDEKKFAKYLLPNGDHRYLNLKYVKMQDVSEHPPAVSSK